jgi:ankyrin repeat protein
VEALVGRLGADVDQRNALGQTALHYAALAGEAGACRRLVALGARTSARCRAGRTPEDDAELQGFDDAAAACSRRAAAAAAAVAAEMATRSTALSSSGGGGGGWRRTAVRSDAQRFRTGEARRRD